MNGHVERPISALLTRLWSRLDEPAMEYFSLHEIDQYRYLSGHIVHAVEGAPSVVHYMIQCDADWVTREAHVHVTTGAQHQSIALRRDADGRWYRGNTELTALAGVADVDISATPSTNTLPVRRLKLGVGESASTDAAWVRVPDLTVERLPQRYARVAASTYKYESDGGSFTATIELDEEFFATQYGDLWTCIGRSRG